MPDALPISGAFSFVPYGIATGGRHAQSTIATELVVILTLASHAVAVMSVDKFAGYINQQAEKLYKAK